MGGILGLWLGGSMLSVFETFDLLCFEHVKSYFRCNKRLRRLSFVNENGTILPDFPGQANGSIIKYGPRGSQDTYFTCKEFLRDKI